MEGNPLIIMLGWRVRKLSLEEISQVLAAVAQMGEGAFTLTDLFQLLPQEMGKSRKKRRSVGNLLQNLANLGYLSKPSERKWVKNAPTLSHYLSQALLDLSAIEKKTVQKPRKTRVMERRERLNPPSSR